MKLLTVQKHTKASKIYEADPRRVKTLLGQIFKQTDYDYAIASRQGRLYIMELRQDTTEISNPRESPQWNTTEIKYHPLAWRLFSHLPESQRPQEFF